MARLKKGTFFFLNGVLHRSVHVNRPADKMYAWSYPQRARVGYQYSYVVKKHEKAWKTHEVAELLGRHVRSLQADVKNGHIGGLGESYSLNNPDRITGFWWSEDKILEYHDYLVTVHRGRPRRDGLIRPVNYPTRRELRAIMRQEELFYVKRGDEYLPTWRAND